MKLNRILAAAVFLLISSVLFAEGSVTPAAQPDNSVFQQKLEAVKAGSDSALKAAEDAVSAAQSMKQEIAALKTELENVRISMRQMKKARKHGLRLIPLRA